MADAPGEIVGRVSDGLFRDDVPVSLLGIVGDEPVARTSTAKDANGISGRFRFGPDVLGAAGSQVRIATVLQDPVLGDPGAIVRCIVPPAGQAIDIRFVLPPIGKAAVLASLARDADTCATCAAVGQVFRLVREAAGAFARLRAEPATAAPPAETPDTLPPDSSWRSHRAGNVQVDYAIAGPHALAPESLAQGDPPEHVRRAAEVALRAIAAFRDDQGLEDAAGGGVLRVRFCAMAAPLVYGETMAAWDHVRINVLNTPAQNDLTIPHEVFHRVQYRYNDTQDMDAELHRAIREGGATLAEECLAPDANRYVVRAMAYFGRPWIPIATPLEVGGDQPYAAALFWRYLEERQPGLAAGMPRTGAGPGLRVMGMIMQATATRGQAAARGITGYRFGALRQRLIKTVRFDQFARLADPDRTLACTDTLYGNWLLVNALNRRAAAIADPRFRYEEFQQSTPEFQWHGGKVIRPTRLVDLPWPIMAGDSVQLAPGRTAMLPQANPLAAWSARYFRFVGQGLVRLDFACPETNDPPLVAIARIGQDGRLFIRRGEGPKFGTHVLLRQDDELFVVVGARTQASTFLVQAAIRPPAPLPFVTGWNCAPGSAHETDPDRTPWTWTSPDIALADGATRAIAVRVANHGDAPAPGIMLRLEGAVVQDIADPFAFAPLKGPDGTAAAVQLAPLAPGAAAEARIAWLPDQAAPAAHWLIRAIAEDFSAAEPAIALGRLAPLPD